MKETLVSVITVSFNSEQTIEDTLNSILNQSYTEIEYIVVDGNSTDNTVEIIKSYENKFKEKGIIYRWISEPDKGIYDAMNKGLKMAKGELIGILNSDDWYETKAIEEIIRNHTDSKKQLISGSINKVNSNKAIVKTVAGSKHIPKSINKAMPINHPATFIHKDVYREIGYYDTRFKLSADYDLTFRMFQSNIKFTIINSVIVNMRNTGATHQLKNLFITAKEDHIIRMKNNVAFAGYYYCKRLIFNCLVIVKSFFKTT